MAVGLGCFPPDCKPQGDGRSLLHPPTPLAPGTVPGRRLTHICWNEMKSVGVGAETATRRPRELTSWFCFDKQVPGVLLSDHRKMHHYRLSKEPVAFLTYAHVRLAQGAQQQGLWGRGGGGGGERGGED